MNFSTKALVLAMFSLGLPGVAANADTPGPQLDVLRTKQLISKYHATGVQQYECDGKSWVHQGPSAVLLDESGKVVGTHYSCAHCEKPEADETKPGKPCKAPSGKPPAQVPSWNFFDGGRGEGTVLEKVPSKTKDSVPQLSLKFEGNGKGKISASSHVLRVNTVGGNAPAGSQCNGAADTGKWFASKYQADYEFRNIAVETPRPGETAKPKAESTDGSVKAE